MTEKSFFDVMLDDRVGEVIAEKKAQLSILEESAVDAVIESTPILQNFCSTYRSLNTDQERYAYYIQEYATLTKHLKQQYDGIYKLYKNGIVYSTLQKEYPGYIPSLLRMLGLLYVFNNAFNDKLTMDVYYDVDYHTHKKVFELVDPSLRPAIDTNRAKPFSSWPTPPALPEECEVTAQPIAPTIVIEEPEKPSLPAFSVVSSPDELSPNMQDPGTMPEPTPPAQEIPHPGAQPTLPWESIYVSLYDAYKQGILSERALFGASQTVTLKASANHSVSLDEGEHYYQLHFYNSDEERTYLGFAFVRPGASGSYPADLALPTIKPSGEHSFVFDGWVYENGEPADLSSITADTDVYASYKPIPRECIVTWDMGDRQLIEIWPYGSVPEFTGSTERAPSPEFVYTFSGWDSEFSAIFGDVTYTAQYTTVPNRHKVTFVMGDGSLVEKEYAYGKALSEAVPPQKPFKEADAQYTYTFAGWEDGNGNRYADASELPLLTGPVTFTAVFDKTVNTYTVTWIVDGVTTTEDYDYGTMPVYKGSADSIPVKTPTPTQVYPFTGWDHELEAVTGDVAYTAQFGTEVRKYTINFILGDKTVSTQVEYGAMPQFEGIPQRDPDVQYEYSFVAWETDFEEVTADAEYVALFDKKLRKYPVTFVVGDQEITANFDYGKVPSFPSGVPTVPFDDRYYYRFTGWDQTPVAVNGTPVTYTACFEPVCLVPLPDGEGVLTNDGNGKYELQISNTPTVDVSAIFDNLGSVDAQSLQLYFDKAVLEFPKAQIDAFYNMRGAIGAVTMSAEKYGEYNAYRIELMDAKGEHIQFLMAELTVKLPYRGAYSADVYHVEDDGTLTKLSCEYKDGYLVFSTMDFSTFVIMDKYSITTEPSEFGVVTVPGEAYEGDSVTFTPDPDEGFVVDSVLVQAGGQTVEVQQENGVYSFIMPKGNVQVTTTFKVVEGGSAAEVIVGVVTALLIVSIGIVVAVIIRKKKTVKL